MYFYPSAHSIVARAQLALLALFALTTTLVLVPNRARACSCMPQTVEQAKRDADAVFEAHVTEVQAQDPVRVRAKVVRQFKGAAVEQVELLTARDSAMCGYAFEVGQSYLVYADHDEGRLHVSLCSRTQRIADADEDLRVLGMGVTPFEPGAESESDVPPSDVSPPARGGCASCTVGAQPARESSRQATRSAGALTLLALAVTCRRRSRSRS
jgi:hypothetical protein